MKILAFVDLHNSLSALGKIKQKAKKEKPDLIVCAGDLTIFEHSLDYLLSILNRLNIPILIINGNHESIKSMKAACSLFKNIEFIHDKVVRKNDLVFFGYGGGGFSTIDKDFEKSAKRHKKDLKHQKIVLVTHAPPYGTKVDKINGIYCGCKSITRFVKKFRPVLVICGHLHENKEKSDFIRKTKIINPGPFGKIIQI